MGLQDSWGIQDRLGTWALPDWLVLWEPLEIQGRRGGQDLQAHKEIKGRLDPAGRTAIRVSPDHKASKDPPGLRGRPDQRAPPVP